MHPEHNRSYRGLIVCLTVAIQLSLGMTARAEDGYRLWLRYDPLPQQMIGPYQLRVASVVAPGNSATLAAIRAELVSGCTGLLGRAVPVAGDVDRDGAVVVGTPKSSPLIAGLKWEQQLTALGPEGFRIR